MTPNDPTSSGPANPGLDRASALERARGALGRLRHPGTAELAVLDAGVVEKPTVFVFRLVTKRFTETRDRRDALFGANLLIVDRRDGSVTQIEANGPIDAALERWARTRAKG
jgi:hypothetical protein